MRTISLILVAAACACALQADVATFRQWMLKHHKVYTRAEEARRFLVWRQTAAEIEQLNAEGGLAVFGLNQFSDLTHEEYKTHLGYKQTEPETASNAVTPDDVDDTVDMTHMLPPVKNQGSCGSCYAFSAIGNMEGLVYKRTGQVTALSEQHIIACDCVVSQMWDPNCYPVGCNGGVPEQVDQWVVENSSGVASEADYPYTASAGHLEKCNTEVKAAAKFNSFKNFKKVMDDGQLIEHLNKYGPLSIGIEGSSSVFQNYQGGIITKKCGTSLDHGVVLVGYGTDNTGVKYWKVRNSWGAQWGEKGYVRMIRGENTCGINKAIVTMLD